MDFDLITLPVRDIAAPAFTDGDAAILGAFPCPPIRDIETAGAGPAVRDMLLPFSFSPQSLLF